MAKAKPTVKLKVDDSDDSQIITALLTCVGHCCGGTNVPGTTASAPTTLLAKAAAAKVFAAA